MRGCQRDPETSGTARYARITNRGNEKPFFLQGVGKGHRIVFLADDQWKNCAFGFAIRFAGKQSMKQFDIFQSARRRSSLSGVCKNSIAAIAAAATAAGGAVE